MEGDCILFLGEKGGVLAGRLCVFGHTRCCCISLQNSHVFVLIVLLGVEIWAAECGKMRLGLLCLFLVFHNYRKRYVK